MNERLIYLAGKCNKDKWALVKGITKSQIKFISSDIENSFYNGNHTTCKGHCVTWYDENKVVNTALEQIESCEFMIVYINSRDAFGSIAEIAYASAIGKKIYLFIQDNHFADDSYCNGITSDECQDKYWFVSNFPHVIKIFIDNSNEARKVIQNILSLESPIESLYYDSALKIDYDRLSDLSGEDWRRFYLNLESQYKLEKYRLDFALPELKIAIELDGHDSHKTKEQRTNDANRERYLQLKGWKVIRFTGSEIYKRPSMCIIETLKILTGSNANFGDGDWFR